MRPACASQVPARGFGSPIAQPTLDLAAEDRLAAAVDAALRRRGGEPEGPLISIPAQRLRIGVLGRPQSSELGYRRQSVGDTSAKEILLGRPRFSRDHSTNRVGVGFLPFKDRETVR